MQDPLVGRITANPRYQNLVKTRLRLGWILTIVMLVAYYSYIGIIAFDKELFAERLGDGVMTPGYSYWFWSHCFGGRDYRHLCLACQYQV